MEEEYIAIMENITPSGFKNESNLFDYINQNFDGAQPEIILKISTSAKSIEQDVRILIFSYNELFYLKLMGLDNFRVLKTTLNQEEVDNLQKNVKIENDLYFEIASKIADYDISQIIYNSMDNISFLNKEAVNIIKNDIQIYHDYLSEKFKEYSAIQDTILGLFNLNKSFDDFNTL